MRSRSQDAFGEAVLEFHRVGSGQAFIERNDGLISSFDPANYFSEYKEWGDLDRAMVARVEGRTVDVGCGAGRHSLYLQRQGVDILAIDSSPGCVAVTSGRGVEKTQLLRFEDIGRLTNPPYDSVLLLGANLGLLGSRSKARRLLDTLDSVTSDSACIVGTTNDYPETDNPAHLAYHEYNRRRRRLKGTVTIRVRWREYIGDWFDFVFFTQEDLAATLHATAWEIRERIPSTGGPQVGYIICKTKHA